MARKVHCELFLPLYHCLINCSIVFFKQSIKQKGTKETMGMKEKWENKKERNKQWDDQGRIKKERKEQWEDKKKRNK